MPSASFERTLDVTSSPEECWKVLTDVAQVAGWVTVVGEVHEVEHLESYKAVLTDRFGPFELNADVEVKVVDLEEGRRIRFKAIGSDRHVGTTITVDAEMALLTDGPNTKIAVSGTYGVLGAVATMGAGTIRKKADTIVEEFFSAAGRVLGSPD